MQYLRNQIGAANSHFAWFKTSSLEGLLGSLGGDYNADRGEDWRTISPARIIGVQAAIRRIPRDKRQKYQAALAYISQQLNVEIGAIPVNPRMSYIEFSIEPVQCPDGQGNDTLANGRYKHVHRLRWESSDGDLASLANVRTREWVLNVDQPSGPPFNHLLSNVPYPAAFYHPGQNGSVNGREGYNDDDHMTLNPGLICRRPLQAGSVHIQQRYEYSTNNGRTWHPIEGAAYLLEKGVRNTGQGLRYYFIKENWALHCNRQFRFEVEYPIDTALPIPLIYPPRAGFGRRANVGDVNGEIITHVDQQPEI
jgi:hypothetical protein